MIRRRTVCARFDVSVGRRNDRVFLLEFLLVPRAALSGVCPYGRLQSVMQTRYRRHQVRQKRGEPRGKAHGPGSATTAWTVIAVLRSVNRNRHPQRPANGVRRFAGCIDACDEIMVKLGRPKGTYPRYDSERGLLGEKRRFVRPRLYLYLLLGMLGLVVSTTLFLRHTAFESNLLHARAA